MSKLDVIKAKLAEILAIEEDVIEVEFASATTDEGVAIFWEGELAEGVAVFVEDEEGNRVALADGTYKITGDVETVVIEVVDGIIKTMTVEEVPMEEPEQTEEPETEPQEEENAEEPEVENPTNEGEETADEAIVKLREEVNELYSIVDGLRREIEELKAKPAAMSATEQFEQMNKAEKNLKGAAKYTQYLKK